MTSKVFFDDKNRADYSWAYAGDKGSEKVISYSEFNYEDPDDELYLTSVTQYNAHEDETTGDVVVDEKTSKVFFDDKNRAGYSWAYAGDKDSEKVSCFSLLGVVLAIHVQGHYVVD